MGVGMVTVVIAILIVICGGGCIYKLCTSPCNVCGWFTSCSSCCKKKQRSRLVLDDGNGGDTGMAVHTSMESLRGENARRAPGNSAAIFNAPYRPRPYTREHRSRSPLNRHKTFQAKRSPSMILERHVYATKSKHPRSSSSNACPSPTFSRHTVAEIGGLSGRSGVASGFGTASGVTSGFSTARFNALPQVTDAQGNIYEMRQLSSAMNLSENLPSSLATSDPASLHAPPSSRAESLLTLQGIIGASSIGNPSNIEKKE